MKTNRKALFQFLIPVLCVGTAGLAPHAGASSAYTIAATNVTMPMSGNGSTQYTVSGIPMTGTLYVSCQYAGTGTKLKIPDCNYGPVKAPTPVTAGQTLKGTILFYPYGAAVPAGLRRMRATPWTGLTLAGVLLLGFRLRGRTRRLLAVVVLAVVTFGGLAAISACGGNPNAMTPGTYQYTLTADNEASPTTPLGQGVSTTISVTVP
ncbi:MAG: hypothetical protein WCA11_03820 [Terracidiphilus sp.]